MENKTVGEEIIDYRAKHRLSMREFARLAGVTLQTIYSIENGRQNPSRITERKIRLVFEEGADHGKDEN